MALFYLKRNMPLHVWSGEDYLNKMPHRNLYEPRPTFQVVQNDTKRRPLKFKLEPLNHKTGIILLDFNTPCGWNVLRWSSASENNYFTTNRFWLLTTKEISDLTTLEDEEIFLPPDSEVKVLVENPDISYVLLDVYKVAAFKPLKYNLVLKNFSQVDNMISALQSYGSVISLREDLENITFDTGLVIAFPDMFTNIEDLSLRHIDTISKVNNRLTIELANKLNMR